MGKDKAFHRYELECALSNGSSCSTFYRNLPSGRRTFCFEVEALVGGVKKKVEQKKRTLINSFFDNIINGSKEKYFLCSCNFFYLLSVCSSRSGFFAFHVD